MNALQKKFIYNLHHTSNEDLEDHVDNLLDMFIVIVKNDIKYTENDVVCLSSTERTFGWNYIWRLFYDYYALNHPEMEKRILKKQQSKRVIPEWGDILNTFHYYSRHNEMNTKVYSARLLSENVPPISFEKFKKNPSKYNFLCALKTTDPIILYKYITSKREIPKTSFQLNTHPSHILIAIWEYSFS